MKTSETEASTEGSEVNYYVGELTILIKLELTGGGGLF